LRPASKADKLRDLCSKSSHVAWNRELRNHDDKNGEERMMMMMMIGKGTDNTDGSQMGHRWGTDKTQISLAD